MIEVRGISKRFGAAEVLRGVNMSLANGKLTGLIGPSGSGKSLLTRCVVGLEGFDQGTVAANGHTIGPGADKFSVEAFEVRKRVGIVFPPGLIPPYRTAEELILEGPIYVRGMRHDKALAFCSQWIDRLGIREHLGKFPRQLSTGQLARVSLARALALNPKYLIADEVAASLDPVLAGEVIEIIGELVSDGIGVLVVTHQIEFIRQHADFVYFLMRGTIVEKGAPAEILAHPATPELADFLQGVRRGR